MIQDEKEWKKTQDEATATIKQGENVFQDKIKNITTEDDRTIEDVKKDIDNVKSQISQKEEQKVPTPGRSAKEAEKEAYNVLRRRREEEIDKLNKKSEELNEEYNRITGNKVANLKKPEISTSWFKRDSTKKKEQQQQDLYDKNVKEMKKIRH